MDREQAKRVLRALDGALAVFRDAKGRLTGPDIRIQSMISVARMAMAHRAYAGGPASNSSSPFPGGGSGTTAPFQLLVDGHVFNDRSRSEADERRDGRAPGA